VLSMIRVSMVPDRKFEVFRVLIRTCLVECLTKNNLVNLGICD
jgi:hypothetical protein